MPKFKVSYNDEVTYVTLVEAEDEDEAHDRAMEQLDNPELTKKTYGKYSETNIQEVPADTQLSEVQPEFEEF